MRHFNLFKQINCLILIVLFPLVGLAEEIDFSELGLKDSGISTVSIPVDSTDADTYQRGLLTFHDDTDDDHYFEELQLTDAQKHQAKVWGLTEDQEKRYVELMQNRSGVYWQSAHLSPVEILGINARNPQERKEYATLYAKQLQEKLAKELAWQFAANEAKDEINKGLPLIKPFDTRPFSPYSYQPILLKAGDQLFLLTDLHLSVRHVVGTLLQEFKKQSDVSLNIYFKNNPEEADIEQWAADQNIPLAWVDKGIVTLNTHLGPFSDLNVSDKVPLLVLVRHHEATIVNLSRF